VPTEEKEDPAFAQTSVAPPPPSTERKPFNKTPLLVAFVGLAALSLAFLFRGTIGEVVSSLGSQLTERKNSKEIHVKAPLSQEDIKRDVERALTAEEQMQLREPFEITIPRPFSEDEMEMIHKHVEAPKHVGLEQSVVMWSREDFEAKLEAEEKRRKIPLNWGYRRKIIKLFETHYLAGATSFQNGNYELARDQFIQALSFPVYQNDVKLFRAVVLVMLRPYVNEVIGKLAVINQRSLSQGSMVEIKSIFTSYEMLFTFFDSQDWEKAAHLIASLKKRIHAVDSNPQGEQIQYPPSLATIDAELQNAIRTEASPKSDAIVSWKAILIDLDLKERVFAQNNPDQLRAAQTTFNQAVDLFQQGDWSEAAEKLRAIHSPPELVEEARKRLALIGKVEATQVSG